jgi:SAM-dependent methyltransferase
VDEMKDEFDTIPLWTVRAVEDLGPEYAVPAACRGSGSPQAQAWLAERLGLTERSRLIDVGAGMGGAAELAAHRSGAEVVLVEPMLGACRAARQLFDRPTVAAAGEALPFSDGTFDAAWSLGVLCTSTDQSAMLRELRRIVRPSGAIGLLVYIKTVDQLPRQPEGNDFPTRQGLERLVSDAGMRIVDRAELTDFDSPPDWWQRRVAAVDDLLRDRHHHDPRWQNAADQEAIITELLDDELVIGTMMILAPVNE